MAALSGEPDASDREGGATAAAAAWGTPPRTQDGTAGGVDRHRGGSSGIPPTPPRRARLRRVARRAGLALLLLLAAYLATPTGRYLLRAGWEEARILARRQRIAELVREPGVDPTTRAKLALVLAARDYAADSLGLDVGESFTTYSSLERDTLVLVLSAARQDELRFHTWWFPIVGRVPYKGYFDFDAARAAARDLAAEGHDTYLRPAAAFSTLGWFNDPLLSTTLKEDSLELANTVIHETLHNTFYARGRAVFNESFANFVGSRGAAAFFRARRQERAALETEARWRDERLLGTFWSALYARIDSAFDASPDDRAARLRARREIYREARLRLVRDVGPRLRTVAPGYARRVRMDNAALMARRIYLTDLELFEAVWEREGRDLPRTIRRVVALAESRPKEPFEALREWVGPAAAEAALVRDSAAPAVAPPAARDSAVR